MTAASVKMEKNTLRVPGALKHTSEARSDADLLKEMRGYIAAQPGVRFLADVLTALHAPPYPLRSARAFLTALPPRQVLQAFSERPDLRVRLVRAITGGAPALLRRIPPLDLATQLDLLVLDDLPPAERSVRAEDDRALPVIDLYLKYLDPTDLAAYMSAATVWQYESQDAWWKADSGPAARALMIAEIKSIRQHGILPDSDILDIIGDEAMERDLPLTVRTKIRAAARKAAREGRPFRDADMFASLRSDDRKRDLTDDLADNISLSLLRKVVVRAAEILGFVRAEPTREESADSAAAVITSANIAEQVPLAASVRAAVPAPTQPVAASRPRQPVDPLPFSNRFRAPPAPVAVAVPRPAPRDDAPTADELPHNFGADVLEGDTFITLDDLTR
jgi:hypothetical protein